MRTILLIAVLHCYSIYNLLALTYYDVLAGNYSDSFTSLTSPVTNSWFSVAVSAGSIPAATSVTTAFLNFSTGTSGGIQNGSTNIQFLSTGATDVTLHSEDL